MWWLTHDWVEVWVGLGSTALLTKTSGDTSHIGDFTTLSKTNPYLNPVMGKPSAATQDLWSFSPSYPASYGREMNPAMGVPGSRGPLVYFSMPTGTLYDETQTTEFGEGAFLWANKFANDAVTAYNAKVDQFIKDKDAYTTAMDTEKARQADIIKASFEPATKMPKKPCKPGVRPMEFPFKSLVQTGVGANTITQFPAKTTASGADPKSVTFAYYGATAALGMAGAQVDVADARQTRTGFAAFVYDGAKVGAKYGGHFMGLLGDSSDMTALAKNSPFQFAKTVTANTPGMYVGLYPSVNTLAKADTATYEFEFVAKAW